MLEIVEKRAWGWKIQQGTGSSFSGGPAVKMRKRRTRTMTIALASNKLECDCYPNRVFFVDVHPLCYVGNQPHPPAFIHWMSLLLFSITINDPIIAVVKIGHAEADDVVATLVDQVLQRGLKTVIASPDKDFKQLISENVQLLMPIPDLKRWSFYTLKHYMAQYNCDPSTDLSLRCIMGDESDCIPGLAQVAPGFGRKTAVKLLKKHGSLENLLNAAAVQTVGKPYAQDALTKHAAFLRRNMQVLSLRRDVRVELEKDWCRTRDTSYDVAALSKLERKLSRL